VTDFTLPELGENIESGDVLRILVKPGDMLAKDQPVLELETDKATIEVPSSVAGQVKQIRVKAGDKVKVGQAILTVEDGAGEQDQKTAKAAPASQAPSAPEPPPTSASDARASVPEAGALDQAVDGKRAADSPDEPTVKDARADAGRPEAPEDPDVSEGTGGARATKQTPRREKVVDISRGSRSPAETTPASALPQAPAAPSVRRMAREVGVDINDVPGTGPGGRISIDDVKAHVSRLVSGASAAGTAPPLGDFSRWGEVDRQPMRGIRRKTAEHLALAWATIPHVTQHDVADITALEEFRHRYAKEAEAAGGNLTVTAVLVKTVAAALRKFPQFNASVDMASHEIVYKKYVNIGIAVDTDRGLLVPVIRDADAKNVTDISVSLVQLSEKARQGKLSLDEMQGGCFSISNLGGIGGTAFTPIVNAPEVAILGVSRARMEPVYREDQFVPRLMLPLSLSYDHRVIDGADGIRFLRWIVEALEQPFLLALQG
jgi:pyruvate dehydrogenase E2 component (dihydrolipoamide acetyltransferase)